MGFDYCDLCGMTFNEEARAKWCPHAELEELKEQVDKEMTIPTARGLDDD